jgi:hypothetical protein
VDTCGENNTNIVRPNPQLNEPPHQQIDDLRACRRPRRIRHYDEHALIRRDDLFERLRIKGIIKTRADLGIRKRAVIAFLCGDRRWKHRKTLSVKI